jgi:uncharacterized protein (DUF488 family)
MEDMFTVGHSTHPIGRFIELLKLHDVTALVDVRSHPQSRFNPQFNREALSSELHACGVMYVFLGKELGARSSDPRCYESGRASYDLIAKSDLFQQGLQRVLKGAETFRLALMCAEKDPLHCHRTILVARRLVERGAAVKHILVDGTLEAHDKAILRLIETLRVPPADMLRSQSEVIEDAYRIQGNAIAYQEREPEAEQGARAMMQAGGSR